MAQPSKDPSEPVDRDPSEPFLRAFVRARGRGDESDMSRAWEALLLRELTRVQSLLRLKRHPALQDHRLSPEDVEDVTQQVWLRLYQWLQLEGSSLGEFRAIIRNQVNWAFQDHVRDHVRDDKERAGSFDDTAPEGESSAAFVRRVEDELAERLLDPIETSGLGRAVVSAIGDLPERRRQVVVLRLRGYSAKEVAAKLDIEPANADQLYSRGLRDLRTALQDYR